MQSQGFLNTDSEFIYSEKQGTISTGVVVPTPVAVILPQKNLSIIDPKILKKTFLALSQKLFTGFLRKVTRQNHVLPEPRFHCCH